MVEEREQRLLSLLARNGFPSLDSARILEVGCGTGSWLCSFARWGASPENICGVDLLPDRIAQARKFCPAGVQLQCQDATRLDFPDASFDLVLQSTVFTSILHSGLKQMLAGEMVRLARPGGLILWYDFLVNNPWNPDVRGVREAEIRTLFAGCRIYLERLTLAPPLGRRIAPISPPLYRAMSRIKLLCTHYLGIIFRP